MIWPKSLKYISSVYLGEIIRIIKEICLMFSVYFSYYSGLTIFFLSLLHVAVAPSSGSSSNKGKCYLLFNFFYPRKEDHGERWGDSASTLPDFILWALSVVLFLKPFTC